MNKSVVTNLFAAALVVLGYVIDNALVFSVGLFALSGAVTNWLAIHMLFEKVPLLYGSGVIVIKFEQFKSGIRDLILKEFFNRDKIAQFIEQEQQKFDLAPVIQKVDLSPAFDKLVAVIEASQFGAMLGMFGGKEALEPMRESFQEKMKEAMSDIAKSDDFHALLAEELKMGKANEELLETVEDLVDKRLAELTPQMVKEIIQTMIKTHLGWLVVWGGVFGGLFGLAAHLV
ncbi:DUF445 domain-containing protein [Pseudoalteromonas xiamenensis]|uniref:DUF445 domain-containing protein n=1 Tax=Pseudoalteromonas xiamenensis TaxID=882626 RepID=A0A975HL11_9GAMM|nr:DUF445 domain-containing protein [Pseudoalteromonas xiamenensis]QTH71606.1 DUF445 domain-containing protein [Pseudoalteromonas xiamenensis]